MDRIQNNFCLILRDHLSGECRRDIETMSMDEWHLIYEAACDNHLLSLLFYQLKNHQLVFPAEIETVLRNDYLRFSGNDLRRKVQLREMIRLFNEHGIDHILLKGSHLAEKVYSNSALRPMCDIDVLIEKSEFKKAYELLITAGYISSKPNNYDSQSGNNKHFPPLIKKGGLAVELHWNINSQSNDHNMEMLWSRSETMAIGNLKTKILSPEDLLQHISFHKGYDNMFVSSLMVLNDIKEICSGNTLNWDKLLLLATSSNEWGNTKCLFSALYLCHKLLEVDIPESFLNKIKPDDFDKKYEQLLINQLFTRIDADMSTYGSVNALYKLNRGLNPRLLLKYLMSPRKICLTYDKKYSWHILPGLYGKRIIEKSRCGVKACIGILTNKDSRKLYETSKASSEIEKWLKS